MKNRFWPLYSASGCELEWHQFRAQEYHCKCKVNTGVNTRHYIHSVVSIHIGLRGAHNNSDQK